MPSMSSVFHRSCTLAWACTKLCTVCMTNGIYMAVSILPCRAMNILAFHVIHYILHILAKFVPSLSKPLSCFSPRMVNTCSNPAAPKQGEASAVRGENLPHPPSLAEVMLEAERNKRETNRL